MQNEINLVRVKTLTGNEYLGAQIMENLRRAEIFILVKRGVVVCWEIRRLDLNFISGTNLTLGPQASHNLSELLFPQSEKTPLRELRALMYVTVSNTRKRLSDFLLAPPTPEMCEQGTIKILVFGR